MFRVKPAPAAYTHVGRTNLRTRIEMSKIKILLIDDEDSFRLPLGMRLIDRGFDVDSFDSPEILNNLDKNAFPYDVVILDYVLGMSTAAIFVRKLKSACPHVEIIVMTGWGIDSSALEILRAGAYRFMAKPLNMDELEITVHAAVEHRNFRQRAQSYDSDRIETILFLAANPLDSNRLRLDEEIRSIDLTLIQTKYGGYFDLRQHWAVRISDLQGYFLRHKPSIVHFSGHGSTDSEIILEDNSGNSQVVPAKALSKLFSILKSDIKCVVLNLCYSEKQANAISEHGISVVGMARAIGDKAAISFSAAFYHALGYGESIQTAFDLGCSQIDLESLKEQDTPKLISMSSDPSSIYFV